MTDNQELFLTSTKRLSIIKLVLVQAMIFSVCLLFSAENDLEKTEPSSESRDFLFDRVKDLDFMPNIFRCLDCGYEQDQEGFCPDHTETSLIIVPDRTRDPLEPVELDGNEDLIVDMPLSGLKFRSPKNNLATHPLLTD